MILIIGLGNPGREYESTRHNIGFMVAEKLAQELISGTVSWKSDTKHKAHVIKTGGDVVIAKPQTFMNLSGTAVRGLADYYKISPQDVWVIHDDIDLPLGKIRIRSSGAAGGHNGVDSIITALGTDKFTRFRLGVGRGKESIAENSDKKLRHRSVIDYVLSRFNRGEAGSFKHLIKNGVEAVRIGLIDGIDKAMNRFN
jgi:peptidyl-tRNA hydrolase, PTH1 family